MPSQSITIHQQQNSNRPPTPWSDFSTTIGDSSRFERRYGKSPLFLINSLENGIFHSTTQLDHFKLTMNLMSVPKEGIEFITPKSTHKLFVPDRLRTATGLLHINFSNRENREIRLLTTIDLKNSNELTQTQRLETQLPQNSAYRYECETSIKGPLQCIGGQKERESKPLYLHSIEPSSISNNTNPKQVNFSDIKSFRNHRIIKPNIQSLVAVHSQSSTSHRGTTSLLKTLNKIKNELQNNLAEPHLTHHEHNPLLSDQLEYVERLISNLFSIHDNTLSPKVGVHFHHQHYGSSLSSVEMEPYSQQSSTSNQISESNTLMHQDSNGVKYEGIRIEMLEPSESTPLLQTGGSTPESLNDKRHWEKFWWRSYLYVASHGLGSCVLYLTTRVVPPSGSIHSGPEGPQQIFNNVASQAIYGVAVIAWVSVAIKVGELAYQSQGKELPVNDPWSGFLKNSVTYMVSGPLSMIPAGAIYELFPKSGTLNAHKDFKQLIDNFFNGTLNNAAFIASILLVECCYMGIEKFRQLTESTENEPGPIPELSLEEAAASVDISECEQIDEEDDDDAITAVLRVALGFTIGGGFTAVALLYLAEWLPQSGMPGAGDGIGQVGIDVLSASIGYAATIVGGGVIAEMIIQSVNKQRELNRGLPI